MEKLVAAILLTLTLTGCARYWVKSGVNDMQANQDVTDCRVLANQGGQKVYRPMDIEAPCMMGKGYRLTYDRP